MAGANLHRERQRQCKEANMVRECVFGRPSSGRNWLIHLVQMPAVLIPPSCHFFMRVTCCRILMRCWGLLRREISCLAGDRSKSNPSPAWPRLDSNDSTAISTALGYPLRLDGLGDALRILKFRLLVRFGVWLGRLLGFELWSICSRPGNR